MIGVDGQANCPNSDNYAPCTCSGGTTSPSILCSLVPLATVASIFSQTQPINGSVSVDLRPANSDVTNTIPANVLGSKAASTISFRCQTTVFQLQINPDAFLASRSTATRVTISYCNLAQLDLQFLTAFNKLSYLGLTSSIGLQSVIPTLPYPLPSLTSLNFYASTGLNETTSYPQVLVRGITDADFGASSMNDLAAYRLLNWLVASSNRTLQTMYMDSNFLTKVPPFIPSFTALYFLDISFNQITAVLAGQLSFSVPVIRLSLSYNKINSIEPSAFQGSSFL